MPCHAAGATPFEQEIRSSLPFMDKNKGVETKNGTRNKGVDTNANFSPT